MTKKLKTGVLGNAIRKARIEKHLSQKKLAKMLKISSTHVKHIESEHRRPSADLLFQIAWILNLSIDELLFPQNTQSNRIHGQIERLLTKCNEKQLRIVLGTLSAMVDQDELDDN